MDCKREASIMSQAPVYAGDKWGIALDRLFEECMGSRGYRKIKK